MSQAVLHLNDTFINKGFEGKPQAEFKPGQKNPKYGIVRFGVTHKRQGREGEAKYDSYRVELRNVPADSKLIELLNAPSTKIAIYGELSQEVFNDKPYQKITADRNALVFTKYGDKEDAQNAPEQETVTAREF